MRSVEEAETILSQYTCVYGTQYKPLPSVIGCILAENVYADRSAPPYNRVAMDGIAVSIEEYLTSASCTHTEGIAQAGAKQCTKHNKNSCIEVSTGAILPNNTDAVIPYEYLTRVGEHYTWSGFTPTPMCNVHIEASDYTKGSILLHKGVVLTVQDISLLASVGKATVLVAQPPKIAIITTGDELIPIEHTPETHQIRASNSIQIQLLLAQHGFSISTVFHTGDTVEELAPLLTTIANEYDLIICIGGISKGVFDVVRNTIQSLGITPIIDGIMQRPGKPFFFSTINNTPFFALPGNPLACTITARRYILPFLYTALGATIPKHYRVLGSEYAFKKQLTRFLLVNESVENSTLMPIVDTSSGNFFSLTTSTGFLELPADQNIFTQGEEFQFFPWGYL